MSNSIQRPSCEPGKPKIIPRPLLFWEIYENWSRISVKSQFVKIKKYTNKPKEPEKHDILLNWVFFPLFCIGDHFPRPYAYFTFYCFPPKWEFPSSEFSLNIIHTNAHRIRTEKCKVTFRHRMVSSSEKDCFKEKKKYKEKGINQRCFINLFSPQ